MNPLDNQGIYSLPTELIQRAFSFLDPASLAEAMRVCQLWNGLANEEGVWSALASRISSGACFSKQSLRLQTHTYVLTSLELKKDLTSSTAPTFAAMASESYFSQQNIQVTSDKTVVVGPYKVITNYETTKILHNLEPKQGILASTRGTYVGIWRGHYLVSIEKKATIKIANLREANQNYTLSLFPNSNAKKLPDGRFTLHGDALLFTPEDSEKKCFGYSLKTETILFKDFQLNEVGATYFIDHRLIAVANDEEIKLYQLDSRLTHTVKIESHSQAGRRSGSVLDVRVIDNCVVAVVQNSLIDTEAKVLVWKVNGTQVKENGSYEIETEDEDDGFSYCFLDTIFAYQHPDSDKITLVDINNMQQICKTEGVEEDALDYASNAGFFHPYFEDKSLNYYTESGYHVSLVLEATEEVETDSLEEGVKRKFEDAFPG